MGKLSEMAFRTPQLFCGTLPALLLCVFSDRGGFQSLRFRQEARCQALAAAGSAGEDWTEAMHQAVKVRDAYSSRSKELAQAVRTRWARISAHQLG